MKRKYKVLIDKEDFNTLKSELESLESSIRIPESSKKEQKPIIKITVTLISKNKGDLVLQTIKSNDGEVVGEPVDVGEFNEKISKLKIIKNNLLSLIFTWLALTLLSIVSNLDNLTILKMIVIPVSAIAISFALVFAKKLRLSIYDGD